MKNTFLIKSVTLVVIIVSSLGACKKSKVEPVCDGSDITYDNFVGALVASKCSGSSCHSSGSGNSTFNSYASMQTVISNGKFNSEVLVNQTMPENSSLSQEQLNKLQCWVDNGYPEN